ncbi:MAG: tetratricopeptide repeat protein [Nitriliruptorales bacterium]
MVSVRQEAGEALFAAEAAYAESIVMSAVGDLHACVASVELALDILPTYAPAILTMGSIDYQLGHVGKGRRRLLSLLDLPDGTPDLPEILDRAGDFLIGLDRHRDGLTLYQRAAARFPDVAALHQGVSCCAGNEGRHELAIAASEAALELEPDNQELVNDMGWSLFEGDGPEQALPYLQRAVAMDPSDPLAAENLRICREALHQQSQL